MGVQYSLTCINNSSQLGSFAVFQQPRLLPPPALQATASPLVWLSRPAAPDTQVTFQWASGDSFVQAETGNGGSLPLEQLPDVVPDRTAVGVGMSGAGTFVVQATPDTTAAFAPQPNCWVVFGNFQDGQVIEVEGLTGAVEVSYGGPVTSRTVVLHPDNTLSVS